MFDISISHPQIGKSPRWNFSLVSIGQTDFYFSYTTLIAFRFKGYLVCSENIWSNTTGRHLNYIQPDKNLRTDTNTFEKLSKELLSVFGYHYNQNIDAFLSELETNEFKMTKESNFQKLHKKINNRT